jgi:VWFA-related protein
MTIRTWRTTRAVRRLASAAVVAAATGSLASAQSDPQFRSGVERLTVDVTVVDSEGRPVTDLRASEFQVSVDGARRRVTSAEWVPLSRPTGDRERSALPEGFTSNQNRGGGRLILVVVDQPSIRPGASPGIRSAMDTFLDELEPSDLVAAVGLGTGAPATPFSTDRALVKRALVRMRGQRERLLSGSRRTVDLGTALAINRGEPGRMADELKRQCATETDTLAQLAICESEVRTAITAVAVPASHEGQATLRGLRELFAELTTIDAPKTVILLSEGFVLDGTQGEAITRSNELTALAASAQASLYVLHVDEQMIDLDHERRAPVGSPPSDERRLRRESLETLASSARGGLFSITGMGTGAFQRLQNEMSGYYLLGVESTPEDLRGVRPLRVSVSRSGVTVRGRRLFGRPQTAVSAPATPREQLTAALNSPLGLATLPLRAATFSLQGTEPGMVQLLIRTDLGDRFSGPQNALVAFRLTDGEGRVAATQAFTGNLTPSVDGLPSPLAYAVGASIAPGEYTLKVAALVGDAIGSIVHPVHAELTAAGSLTLSDLTVGGPVPTGRPTMPTVDSVVRFGVAHGYLEAYGAAAAKASGRFEVLSDADRTAIVGSDVTPRMVGESRAIFSALVPTAQLPPGRYRLRASLTAPGSNAVMSREFDIPVERPLTRVNESVAIGDVPRAPSLFLPVTATELNVPFDAGAALKPELVSSLARALPTSVRPLFEAGIEALRKNDPGAAERSFKEAIQPDMDVTAALAYLGVTYAAAGHDTEATGTWQTALVDSPDYAPLYVWVGEALIRLRDLKGAVAILEDGRRRWPDDARFAWPLAMLYASMGRGREALPQLERHLAAPSPAPSALALGVEWIYRAHLEGFLLHGEAQDLELARRYAALYARANGPRQAMVRQWLNYLSRP